MVGRSLLITKYSFQNLTHILKFFMAFSIVDESIIYFIDEWKLLILHLKIAQNQWNWDKQSTEWIQELFLKFLSWNIIWFFWIPQIFDNIWSRERGFIKNICAYMSKCWIWLALKFDMLINMIWEWWKNTFQ